MKDLKLNQESQSGAIKFLREKKILSEDKTEWIVMFSDGSELNIVDLMEEFAIRCRALKQIANP